ncbi:MAG: DUF6199 family natural product biosynthesis protein [Sphaerochaetaceae bacterium]|jgi:hypothetical protein
MQQIIGGASLIIVGLVLIIFPSRIYQITEGWKHRQHTEPSEAFMLTMRILGTVLCGVGLFVCLS